MLKLKVDIRAAPRTTAGLTYFHDAQGLTAFHLMHGNVNSTSAAVQHHEFVIVFEDTTPQAVSSEKSTAGSRAVVSLVSAETNGCNRR